MLFVSNDFLQFRINIFKDISFLLAGVLEKYLCLYYIGSTSIVSVKVRFCFLSYRSEIIIENMVPQIMILLSFF